MIGDYRFQVNIMTSISNLFVDTIRIFISIILLFSLNIIKNKKTIKKTMSSLNICAITQNIDLNMQTHYYGLSVVATGYCLL